MLVAGFDVNARSQSGLTPIFTNLGAEDDLTKHGADVRVEDNEGNTPVLYNREIWKVVLDFAKDGSTPLTAHMRDPEAYIAEKLLKSGVVVSQRDCEAIKAIADDTVREKYKTVFAHHGNGMCKF